MASTSGQWCFVHAADLHLDTPFVGVGRVDEHVARRLRDASLDAFDALVELTLARDAAFLVLAGDVYDGAERGTRAQLRFERGVRRLADAGIHTFVVHGNHDPLGEGWRLVTDWPEQVHVFGSHEVGSVPVERDGEVLAVVQGISFEERAEQRNLARLFRRTEHDAPHVAVLHTNVGEVGEHANYAPCTLDDLRNRGVDYWALGHVHTRQVVLEGDGTDPWVVYPGNLQGRSIKPSERGAKGASVVPVVGGRVRAPEHVTLDRARFAAVTVDIAGHETIGGLERALARAAADVAAEAGDRVVVLRAELTGNGPLHRELARGATADGLLTALRDRVDEGGDLVWSGLKDRTGPPLDEPDPAVLELLDTDVDLDPDDPRAATATALAALEEHDWLLEPVDPAELADAGHALAASLLTSGEGDR